MLRVEGFAERVPRNQVVAPLEDRERPRWQPRARGRALVLHCPAQGAFLGEGEIFICLSSGSEVKGVWCRVWGVG